MPRPLESVTLVHQEADPFANLFHFFFKVVKTVVIILVLFIFFDLLALSVVATQYLSAVSTASGMPARKLLSIAKSSFSLMPPQTDNKTNFLLLGIDTLANRDTVDINTDTIMVISVNSKTNTIHTFGIPRDLYLDSKGLKINGIYNQALKNKLPQPELQTKAAVESLTGLPIHHVLVLDLSKVGSLIDALGGVDIEVERSFTDTKFPRPNVDVRTEKNPAVLYETISFQKGTEHMSGARALTFIRSRHSLDPIEGTDDARVARQEHVIAALIAKLKDAKLFKDHSRAGSLLGLYDREFSKFMPLSEALALARVFALNNLAFPQFVSHSVIPLLYHPDRFKTGQWVYLPTDPTGTALKSEVEKWVQ